jgi:endonuclease/exonuclease/phosphatase family metal-dependent hydrolase
MLKLISLNIERCAHLDRNIPFLVSEAADIVCLQEVLRCDLPVFSEALQKPFIFLPMHILDVPCSRTGKPEQSGIALFTSHIILDSGLAYYHRAQPTIVAEDIARRAETNSHGIVWATVALAGEQYTVATTHFPVSAFGQPDSHQRAVAPRCIELLVKIPPHILCGDLNAPRGGEIFTQLSGGYTDAIPEQYHTSLDLELHRMGSHPEESRRMAQFMVDGLLLQDPYVATNVRLVSGVSDHMAIVAEIRRS